MNSMMRNTLAVASLLVLSACNGAPQAVGAADAANAPAAAESTQATPSVDAFKDFINEIRRFAGSAQVVMGDEAGDAVSLAVGDRIVTGFEQYPPRQLSLADGSTIYWGWQHGQAFVQSIAIRGTDGQLQLLGAVDDLPVLYSRRANRAIADQQAYDAFLRESAERGGKPAVALFIKDDNALAAYYPLVARWLQAAMLGFNADCSDPAQGPTCAFVEQVSVPVEAYARDCAAADTVNACALVVPDIPAADVPLESFKQ
ncbi:hypothetical protein [Marilutibacter alkalisoli]|uniref:Lipoprotein n=1 Tax=Marilutibacter alkalisoli TaxID=2591633 RepID=A0A514BW99_9GAMM|nr:hypothetical protein [Lysobacter alkalisoli]QDH71585.1 hypothetical protein FKV23_16895 [Lysobacter alkalisoli]